MATIGGRTTTGPAGGVASGTSNANVSQREDLANFITMITRDETPFLSSIGKSKATAIFHEWQTDELASPGNSKLTDGADFAAPGASTSDGGAGFNPVGPERTRLGNYTQINGKTIAVSGTRRAVDQAGVADEYAYQLKKRGTELRRDVEHDLVNGYQVANGSGIRTMGGFQSFVNSEDTCVYASGTAVSSANANKGTHAPTLLADASRSALSLTDIDAVMQKIYEQGGKATKVMVSPKLRRDFSDLMVNDSGVRRNIDSDGKLRQSVDIYMSDFGDLMVVPNYIMGLSTGTAGTANDHSDSCALIYDPQWFALATLRPLAEVDVGQKGDSTVGMLVEETTLEVKNPLGCGAIYGLK
jgi:hypothetical protein